MRVVFLGPPGAGKGTQAAQFAARLAIPHISTGEILRTAVADATPLGRKAKAFMDSGRLVPDEVVNGIVAERIDEPDCREGFVLDGFPRTVAQAQMLDAAMTARRARMTAVIDFEVPEEELVRRLLARGRADDTPATVQKRLGVYEAQTKPLTDWYRAKGLLRAVDGMGAVEAVQERLFAALAVRR